MTVLLLDVVSLVCCILIFLESSEEEECLSSSAVQFDPSGNRVLLGTHHVDAEVILKNLKDVYDKNQKKTLTGSEQRITNSRIDMVATATAEIRGLKVYVQRCPESTRDRKSVV